MIDVRKVTAFTGHSSPVYALEAGVSDNLLFSGSGDKFLALWNLETLEAEKFAAKFPSTIYTICYVPERKIMFIGTSAGSIHVLDLERKTEIKILQHHTDAVFSIRYSIITNCFYSVGADGNFAVCSLESLSLLKIKKLCNQKVRSIDFSFSKNEIAIACGDGYIRIFEMDSLYEKYAIQAHAMACNCVRYNMSGDVLLSGGKDAHLNVWDKEYQLIKSIPAHNFAIYDIQFSPDGELFATASRDKTLKIWDSSNYELLKRINNEMLQGHVNSVNKIYWTSFTNYLISASDDRSVMVWDITKR